MQERTGCFLSLFPRRASSRTARELNPFTFFHQFRKPVLLLYWAVALLCVSGSSQKPLQHRAEDHSGNQFPRDLAQERTFLLDDHCELNRDHLDSRTRMGDLLRRPAVRKQGQNLSSHPSEFPPGPRRGQSPGWGGAS